MSTVSDSRSATLIGDYLDQEARNKPEARDQLLDLNAAVQKKSDTTHTHNELTRT